MTAPVGLVLGSSVPPDRVAALARAAEDGGFAELWVAEDYFFTGGISCAAAVLAATRTIPVGLGVISAMVRHPAVLAMEIATLSRMHPGRLRPGMGTGVPAWLRQMNAQPRSLLTAMREALTALRALLDGEELTLEGTAFVFDRVRLTHPPHEYVPLLMGVIGPKLLALSGAVADGNVLSALSSVEYVRWARAHVAAAARAAGREQPRRMTTFALFCASSDGAAAKAAARSAMAFYLTNDPRNMLTESYGIADEVEAILAAGDGAAGLERAMPDQWVEDLTVAGEPDECAEKAQRLLAAGSDSIALFPVAGARTEELITIAIDDVLPRLVG